MSKRSGLLRVMAECRTCGWELESRNAMGVAARHATRTGHEVAVEQTIAVTWNASSQIAEV